MKGEERGAGREVCAAEKPAWRRRPRPRDVWVMAEGAGSRAAPGADGVGQCAFAENKGGDADPSGNGP